MIGRCNFRVSREQVAVVFTHLRIDGSQVQWIDIWRGDAAVFDGDFRGFCALWGGSRTSALGLWCQLERAESGGAGPSLRLTVAWPFVEIGPEALFPDIRGVSEGLGVLRIQFLDSLNGRLQPVEDFFRQLEALKVVALLSNDRRKLCDIDASPSGCEG